MRINYKEDGSYTFTKESFVEYFYIRIADGLLEAGIAKIPPGYIKVNRFRWDEVGNYYIWYIVPFVRIYHKLLDYFEM